MATYDSLSAEQKARLTEFSLLLRPWAGEQARVNNHADTVNTLYLAEASAVLALLDATEEVPNPTGLNGAAPLTQAEMISIVSHIQGILTAYNTAGHRQLWASAAGAANLIG